MAVLSYKITIGSMVYQSPNKTILREVVVNSAINTPVNNAQISLANVKDAGCKPGEPVVIELGSDGKTNRVFSGAISSIEHALDAVNIVAASGMEVLTRTYVDVAFENKNAGAIVKDFVSKAKANMGTVDDGIDFPRFIVSSRKNVWEQLKLLSKYSGTNIYTDNEDKVQFVKYKKSSNHNFTYGEDILAIEKEEIKPTINGVQVYGESPAGQGESDEANFWFKKEEVVGTAGESTGTIASYAVYAARNKDLCSKIATNLFEGSQLISTGRAVVLNGQNVLLGQTVTFNKVPTKSVNGSYKVTAIKHLLNYKNGFTTEIFWEEQE